MCSTKYVRINNKYIIDKDSITAAVPDTNALNNPIISIFLISEQTIAIPFDHATTRDRELENLWMNLK